MINIYKANNSNSAIELLVDEIKKRNIEDSNHLVFCPPNYGYSMEKLIHERLEIPGSFNIEVTSFSRFANKNIKTTRKTLTNEGSVLIAKKAILKLAPTLKHYGKVSGNISFAGKMHKTITMMKKNGYTPEFIRSKAKEMTGATKDKLNDIASIMEAFDNERGNKYIDATERLKLVKETIKNNKLGSLMDVYLVGYTDLSTQEVEILKELAVVAKSINIAVVESSGSKNAELYPKRLLKQMVQISNEIDQNINEIQSTRLFKEKEMLLRDNIFSYAKPISTKTDLENITLYCENNVYEEINGIAHEIVRLVRREGFRYKDINIVSSDPSYSPVISQIFQRYNIPCYLDIKYPLSQALTTSFLIAAIEVAKFGYRKDKVISLIKHPLFISQKLIANSKLESDIKDDIFLYENHILKNNIDFNDFMQIDLTEEGKKFEYIRERICEIGELFYPQIDRYVEKYDDDEALLEKTEESRSEVEDITLAVDIDEARLEKDKEQYLPKILKKGKNHRQVKEYICSCKKIIDEVNESLNNELNKRRQEASFKDNGFDSIEEINIRSNKILTELLETAEDIIGSEIVDINVFDQYIKTLISERSVAMIPRFVDSVFVGDMIGSCIIRPKVIFVIGASSANLISGKAPSGMLNSKDTNQMERNELSVYPTEKDLLVFERFAFIDLLGKFTEKLYVGYSLYNLKGEFQKPSESITEIVSILGLEINSLLEKYSLDKKRTPEELEDIACTKENSFFSYIIVKSNLIEKEKAKVTGENLATLRASLSEEQKRIIPGEGKRETSCLEKGSYASYFFENLGNEYYLNSSAIEAFFRCPYEFFLKYGLKIKEREEGKLDNAIMGIIIHKVLEKYFKKTAFSGKNYQLLLDTTGEGISLAKEANDYIEEAIESTFSETSEIKIYERDPKSKIQLQNIKLECKLIALNLTINLALGTFKPTLFEYKFGLGDNSTAVKIPDGTGKTIAIGGFIDRVDISYDLEGNPKMVLVVDYKTGSAAKGKGKMQKIYMGTEIQPYIYLMAMKNKYPNSLPSGGVYLGLGDTLDKDGRTYKFGGQIVANDESIAALDSLARNEALETGKRSTSSRVLPFNLKRVKDKNEVTTSGTGPAIMDFDSMEKVIESVREIIINAFKDMDSGCFDKLPITGCKDCFMKDACLGAGDKENRAIISEKQAYEFLLDLSKE